MTADIFIATDLSESAAVATATGVDWARRLRAPLVLLHVVHDPELAPALGNDVPGDLQRARAELQAFVDAKAADLAVRVEVLAAEDVPGTIVARAARAGYLFVGSHGRSGLQRLRLGSVATAVLRQSTVPVVCVPPVRS